MIDELAVAAAFGFVLFVVFYALSMHAFGGNSDGATVVLEGESLRAGHVALSGWDLSLDSFWTVDAVVYAVAVALVGMRHELLYAVPALIATAVVLVGGGLARVGRERTAGIAAVVTVIALLGIPNADLAFFLLQGPWHIGTVLWSLVAFAAVARDRFDWSSVVAVVLLAAGLLGDLEMLLIGIAPLLGAGFVAMIRHRSVRRGLVAVTTALGSVALAVAVRAVAVLVGTFSIATSHAAAHWQQVPANLEHLLTWGAALLGLGSIPIGPRAALSASEFTNGPPWLRGVHGIGLVIVLVGVGFALAELVVGMVAPGRESRGEREWRIDDVLVLAFFADLALFVIACPNDNGDYARYLTPGVVDAIVLAGRFVGRTVTRSSSRARVATFASALVVIAAFAIGLATDLDAAAAPQPAIGLGRFLLAHSLRVGIGDYWSSSIVTVETDGAVTVRPVIPTATGQLVRYGRQSDVRWYAGERFGFLVYDTARPWRGVDAASATATFGAPSDRYAVGTYRVLVWAGGVSVSPVGASRS